jgi:hypothetical protein
MPDVAEIDRIAALSDPVLRNLQITQCYFELSAALLERTGSNANWCTFATWASRQAADDPPGGPGTRARNFPDDLARSSPGYREVARLLKRLKAEASLEAIYKTIWQSLNISKAIARSSEAVAVGNRKVFAEIGRVLSLQTQCLGDLGRTRSTGRFATMRPANLHGQATCARRLPISTQPSSSPRRNGAPS